MSQEVAGPMEDMDATLWSALPPELLDRVLACLPVPYLFCLRRVCKRLALLLLSPNFSEICAQVSAPRPELFLFFEDGFLENCFVCDPSVNKWYHLNLASLSHGNGKAQVIAGHPEVIAAHGGLLCLASVTPRLVENKFLLGIASGMKLTVVDPKTKCRKSASHTSELKLTVVNPMTKCWKSLPALHHEPIDSILVAAMVADEATKSYKIVLVGGHDNENYPGTQVYDSKLNVWKQTGYMSSSVGEVCSHAVCRGVLYCLCLVNDDGLDKRTLLAYNLEEEVWRTAPVQLPRSLRDSRLVECSGRLLLLGRGTDESIVILECKFAAEERILLAEIPSTELRDSPTRPGWWMAKGQSDLILLQPTHVVTLTYSVSQNSLRLLPPCPPEFPTDWEGRCFSSHFSLGVSV